MFSLLYDLVLFFVGLAALPRLLWERLRYGKYKNSLRQRLGLKLPSQIQGDQVIWIHAVSLGETRAVSPLYDALRKKFPNASFVISSVTETGHAEAKRTLSGASSYFYLPFDFSWLMRKLATRIKPDLFILVEGEFWYHLLKEVKSTGARALLVNGKLSERSFKRLLLLPFFAKKIFSLIDRFCLQSERYAERFVKLGIPEEKISITGNLKLDITPELMSLEEKERLKRELGIGSEERLVVLGSTHAPEEEELLFHLGPVWKKVPHLKVILVPRHPERFAKVAAGVQAGGHSLLHYSSREKRGGDERIILIDEMGLLHKCYQIADIAVVAGSFVKQVGGHNIFEPVQVGVPVLFGPHMLAQKDLLELVLSSGCGFKISLQELSDKVLELLSDPEKWKQIHRNCLRTELQARGSTERTLAEIGDC